MNNGGKNNNGSIEWEVVDGQQRLTIFVLFLIICRYYRTACDCTSAYSLINRFHNAFEQNELKKEHIADYIDTVMQAHCSCHVTNDKSVAVNIFEMHNTRGVALSTLEILKAKLMQFVYSKGDTEPDENGKTERDRKVADIQNEFGKIYAMEGQCHLNSLNFVSVQQMFEFMRSFQEKPYVP